MSNEDETPVNFTPEPDQENSNVQSEPVRDEMQIAEEVLRELLSTNDGSVSTRVFKRRLIQKGIQDVILVTNKLKYPDEEDAKFYHRGRSFYSPERYAEEERAREKEAEIAEEAIAETEEEVPKPVAPTREYRQEEARLCTYVKDTLADLYGTDYGPDVEYVFDVHNERPGSEFENVDVLAVHWRSDQHVEIVAVEVKLAFNARAVHQASNYSRFADRTWIAVPVTADLADAGAELRDLDPLLFDYVVGKGLGILACRRGVGRSYHISPVHWPQLSQNDPLCRQDFQERYRPALEEAEVIPPEGATKYPIL